MYFLALWTQYWYDSVMYATLKSVKPWDVVQDTQNTYLCLGEEIAFEKLYEKKKIFNFQTPQIIAKKMCSEKTMQIIHRMVGHYFSSYKAVVALFLPRNEGFMKKRESTKNHKKASKDTQQICYIYPNLRTLTQLQKTTDATKAILHGWMSIPQKQKYFIEIQSWAIQTLLATNRGLFFDWQNLTQIHIFDKNNRAYSAKSDPRFVLPEIATYMATVYDAKIYL